jgi:hypothetical protein
MIARTPVQAIVDVLKSAEVKSPFSHEEIAQSILHAFDVCGIKVTPGTMSRAKGSAPQARNEFMPRPASAPLGSFLAEALGRGFLCRME